MQLTSFENYIDTTMTGRRRISKKGVSRMGQVQVQEEWQDRKDQLNFRAAFLHVPSGELLYSVHRILMPGVIKVQRRCRQRYR